MALLLEKCRVSAMREYPFADGVEEINEGQWLTFVREDNELRAKPADAATDKLDGVAISAPGKLRDIPVIQKIIAEYTTASAAAVNASYEYRNADDDGGLRLTLPDDINSNDISLAAGNDVSLSVDRTPSTAGENAIASLDTDDTGTIELELPDLIGGTDVSGAAGNAVNLILTKAAGADAGAVTPAVPSTQPTLRVYTNAANTRWLDVTIDGGYTSGGSSGAGTALEGMEIRLYYSTVQGSTNATSGGGFPGRITVTYDNTGSDASTVGDLRSRLESNLRILSADLGGGALESHSLILVTPADMLPDGTGTGADSSNARIDTFTGGVDGVAEIPGDPATTGASSHSLSGNDLTLNIGVEGAAGEILMENLIPYWEDNIGGEILNDNSGGDDDFIVAADIGAANAHDFSDGVDATGNIRAKVRFFLDANQNGWLEASWRHRNGADGNDAFVEFSLIGAQAALVVANADAGGQFGISFVFGNTHTANDLATALLANNRVTNVLLGGSATGDELLSSLLFNQLLPDGTTSNGVRSGSLSGGASAASSHSYSNASGELDIDIGTHGTGVTFDELSDYWTGTIGGTSALTGSGEDDDELMSGDLNSYKDFAGGAAASSVNKMVNYRGALKRARDITPGTVRVYTVDEDGVYTAVSLSNIVSDPATAVANDDIRVTARGRYEIGDTHATDDSIEEIVFYYRRKPTTTDVIEAQGHSEPGGVHTTQARRSTGVIRAGDVYTTEWTTEGEWELYDGADHTVRIDDGGRVTVDDDNTKETISALGVTLLALPEADQGLLPYIGVRFGFD